MMSSMQKKEDNTHPSIFLTAYSHKGCRGGWSLSQLTSDESQGTPWTGHQSNPLTVNKTQSLNFLVWTCNLSIVGGLLEPKF